jgi:hypothetical protein
MLADHSKIDQTILCVQQLLYMLRLMDSLVIYSIETDYGPSGQKRYRYSRVPQNIENSQAGLKRMSDDIEAQVLIC